MTFQSQFPGPCLTSVTMVTPHLSNSFYQSSRELRLLESFVLCTNIAVGKSGPGAHVIWSHDNEGKKWGGKKSLTSQLKLLKV